MKKIEVIISTPNTDERASGLIRKCMKYMYHKKNTNTGVRQNLEHYQVKI